MNNLEFARKNIDNIDKHISSLISKRMEMSNIICKHKFDNNLNIKNDKREKDLIKKNLNYVSDSIKPYYEHILKSIINESCSYQDDLMSNLNLSYINDNVVVCDDSIKHISEYINIDRKILIVSDTGVPIKYIKIIKKQCENAALYIFEQGEKNKNYNQLKNILLELSHNQFSRKDLVIAVGGGVVGDMAGLAASLYMRGIDFVNIPTTLLSQVDSSIGGKTAIDFDGYKNIIGVFNMPKKVIIDPKVLSTLTTRQFNNGLCEVIKIAITCDVELFEFIENCNNILNHINKIIIEALKIKNRIVKIDPKENNLRRVLNFGHTIGHAVESVSKGELLHGECVSIGMLYMCSKNVKKRLKAVLDKYNLNVTCNCSTEEILCAICHDKKKLGDDVCTVYVEKIGSYKFKMMKAKEIADLMEHI